MNGSKTRSITETSRDKENRISQSRWIQRYSKRSRIQPLPAVSNTTKLGFIHLYFIYLGQKGNGANLCKISAKRRRTNAEVKAAKEFEAQKD